MLTMSVSVCIRVGSFTKGAKEPTNCRISQRRNYSPSLGSHQSSKAPPLLVGSLEPRPHPCCILTALNLCQSQPTTAAILFGGRVSLAWESPRLPGQPAPWWDCPVSFPGTCKTIMVQDTHSFYEGSEDQTQHGSCKCYLQFQQELTVSFLDPKLF